MTTQPADAGGPPPPSSEELLRQALVEGRYIDARTLLESPDMDIPARDLVTGYVDLKLGAADSALTHLRAAKRQFADLSSLITPWEHEALLKGSDLDEALAFAEKARDADEILLVAGRLLDAKRLPEADRMVRRAMAFAGTSQRKQADVRALRAQLGLVTDKPFNALLDWRWLALNTPLAEAAEGTPELIAQYFPQTPLRAEQRYLRATRFAQAGRVAETDRELEVVLKAPYYKVSEGDALHWQGWARYRARDFEVASEYLREAAEKGSHQALRDMYYAARGLSRAGRIEEAIALFEKVSKQTPKGPLTLAARFHIGSEWLVLGEWQKAVDAHSAFMDNYAQSEYHEAARRERAVAWFALGQFERAAYWFRKLRDADPRGSDASLYQLLEAVCWEHAAKLETAQVLLRDLALNTPLSFAGHQSRLRLAAAGQPVPPVATATPPGEAVLPLPTPVTELNALGLYQLAEASMQQLESQWLAQTTTERGRMQCDGYGQLAAGRRRFVIGSHLASSTGFFNRPGDGEDWLWRCVYPTPYSDIVASQTKQWRVSPALVYAVMRQESGFHSTIESSAEARGLMQIIGPTAERIAQELREREAANHMDVPYYNIRFGTFYLAKLLDLFEDNPAPAIAAYNAGPAAALRWRHATSDLPIEFFVARIPYRETRGYVQRVLGNLFVYQRLYPQFGELQIPLTLASSTQEPEEPTNGGRVPWSPELY